MEALKRLGARGRSAASGLWAWARTPQGRRRLGYYGALALLLALLGTASYGYRSRREARGSETEEPPRAALSVQLPAVAALPEPTEEPALWVWPLEGEIVGAYSPDAPVWSQTLGQWQTHPGLDIAGSPGEAVYACGDGTVSDAWSDRLWGNVVVIDHGDGLQSTYASLNTLELATPGDAVKAGQVIGSVGQSAACEGEHGWHLHFEIARDGQSVDFTTLAAE